MKTDEPNKHTAEQKKQLQKSRQCMVPFIEHHKLGRWDVRSQDSDNLGLRETRAKEWAQGQHLLVLILSIF